MPRITLLAAPLCALGAWAADARAEATCPPAVQLSGDAAAVSAVGDLLGARGIGAARAACPAVRARIERRGDALVVGIDSADGAPIERTVTGPATAATVIESWARTDVEAPLLAAHAAPVAVASAAPPAAVVEASPPIVADAGRRGIALFAAEQTAYGSDHTTWQGLQLGVCVQFGPVCAAARLQGSWVVDGPAVWDHAERHGVDLLVGLDVPLALGRVTLAPGFAAGVGSFFTGDHLGGPHMGVETNGLRANVHATLSVPVGRRFAIDVFVAGDMTQATRIEQHGTDDVLALPREPRALVRLGAGLRYGGL